MPTAEELRLKAMTAVRGGNFAGARAQLERAHHEAAGDPDQVALVRLSEAYVEGELNGAAAGLELSEPLVQLTGLSPVTQGRIWSQVGLLRLRGGDLADAVAAYSAAIPLLQDAPEHLGRALLNRGTLHLQRHVPADAVNDLEAARREFGAAGMSESQGKAEHNLGYAQLLLGDLVRALQLMDTAARTLSPMTPVLRSVTGQDRAEVLRAAGRTREAIAALEDAVAAFRSRRLPRFQAECEFVLAETLLQEDPRSARSVARRAVRRFTEHDSGAWADRARALALVADIEAGGRSRSVCVEADALVPALRSAGHRRDAVRLALHTARLMLRQGDLDDAAQRLRRVRTDESTPVVLRLLAREVRAELARARGQDRRSRENIRAGLAELHAWQASFGSLDLQSTLVGHGNGLARMGLELALESGSPAVLLEWSERARALATRVTPVRPPLDPELAEALTELRTLGDAEPQRRQALREQIRQRHWYGAGLEVGPEVADPVGLAELQATLTDTDATHVAHIAVAGRLQALVVAPDDVRVVDLGDTAGLRHPIDRVVADLDMAARHRTGPLAEAVRAGLAADLAGLADRLVTPLLDLVGDRRVVLTPSAVLAGTPWSLLPGLVGRPVTLPPSATRWHQLVGRPLPPAALVGLVAGPDVARAADEVERSAAAWRGATVLAGAQATSGRVGELAARVDVLHLAGHGRHAGDHPLFSAVQLVDGPWFGYDVDALSRVPSVVVLSACELGRVAVRSAEETVGMTAAWLHAGARTVVSAPVLVADDTACAVLPEWHRRVAAGESPADALADAVAGAGDVAPFLCFGAGA